MFERQNLRVHLEPVQHVKDGRTELQQRPDQIVPHHVLVPGLRVQERLPGGQTGHPEGRVRRSGRRLQQNWHAADGAALHHQAPVQMRELADGCHAHKDVQVSGADDAADRQGRVAWDR